MEAYARHILKLFFERFPDAFVQHHIDSYDDFLLKRVPEFLRANNPIMHEVANGTRKIQVWLGGKDGKAFRYLAPVNDLGQPMFPNEARLKNKTYAVSLEFDIDVQFDLVNPATGHVRTLHKTIAKHEFRNIPLCLRSSLCNLTLMPGDSVLTVGECKHELGGYFVVTGKEKVLLSQEQLAANVMYTARVSEDDSDYLSFAEVRSGSEDGKIPPRPHKVFVCKPKLEDRRVGAAKPKDVESDDYVALKPAERGLVLQSLGLDEPIPLAILFRALGVETDADMVSYIMLHTEPAELSIYAPMLTEMLLQRTVGVDGQPPVHIFTSAEALAYIKTKLLRKSVFDALNFLNNLLFPHLGSNLKLKAYYLGYMARKAMAVALGREPPSDRDHFKFKRMDVTGDLMFKLFVRTFFDMRTDFIRKLDKLLTYNAQSYADEKIQNVITPLNINYLLDPYQIGNEFQKSFKGLWMGKNGVSQELARMGYLGTLSQVRRTRLVIEMAKKAEIRALHGSQYGTVCPIESPDGADIGLTKTLSLMTRVSTAVPSAAILKHVTDTDGFRDLQDMNPASITSKTTRVYVNGAWVGIHEDPADLLKKLLKARAEGSIPKFVSIAWKANECEVWIYGDAGRLTRPTWRLRGSHTKGAEGGSPQLFHEDDILKVKDWDSLPSIEYLDAEEAETVLVSRIPAVYPYVRDMDDLTFEHPDRVLHYTHSEIHPSFVYGASASLLPFMHHNASPRSMFAVAQCRQSMGIYHTNPSARFDTISVWGYTTQRPLVQTELAQYVGKGEMNYGTNIRIAIMTFTGYNQEDAMIINAGSVVKRGLFLGSYMKVYEVAEEIQDEATGVKTQIANPTAGKYGGNVKVDPDLDYSQLDADGVIKMNAIVSDTTVLVGMVVDDGNGGYKDLSVSAKRGTQAVVDNIFRFRQADGCLVVKVKLREVRIPDVGDKFASRQAQKGTVGLLMEESDMPFFADGTRPDIIFNPHGIPTRMTTAYFLEALGGMLGCLQGAVVDASPFVEREDPARALGRALRRFGLHEQGETVVYNGMTGQQMQGTVFSGMTYYLRLKHMVADKINYRSTGPVTQLTHQPVGGRANDGGLRIGEMERDALLSHGVSGFLQESMMDRSDGHTAIFSHASGRMDRMDPNEEPAKLSMPYSALLALQEMEAMHMRTHLITSKAVTETQLNRVEQADTKSA